MYSETNIFKVIKKLLFIFLVFISIFNFTSIYAESGIIVEVTEKIPWANCSGPTWTWSMYKCEVQKWFWTVVNMIWNIIQYFTYIAWLWSVLYLIINWIIYSMSWLAESKEDAKKRIKDNLVWIVLLLLSWPILYMIAPWIYKVS